MILKILSNLRWLLIVIFFLHLCWQQIALLLKQYTGIYVFVLFFCFKGGGHAWWVIKFSPAFQERRADSGGATSFQLKISTLVRGTTSAEAERGKRGADQNNPTEGQRREVATDRSVGAVLQQLERNSQAEVGQKNIGSPHPSSQLPAFYKQLVFS